MTQNQQAEEQRYVEEIGIFFEQTGLPRMAGRILGRLSISGSPYQTTGELTEALMVSKGSISTVTRLLIRIGLIERISLPGQRRDYFTIKLGSSHQLLKDGIEQTITFRQLMERGLELTKGRIGVNHQWLEEMHGMYVFLEREFPRLVKRWEQERKAN